MLITEPVWFQENCEISLDKTKFIKQDFTEKYLHSCIKLSNHNWEIFL